MSEKLTNFALEAETLYHMVYIKKKIKDNRYLDKQIDFDGIVKNYFRDDFK